MMFYLLTQVAFVAHVILECSDRLYQHCLTTTAGRDMTTIIEESCQYPLHPPPLLDNHKPLLSVFHHLQVNLVGLLQTAYPVTQPLDIIAAIDPYLA
jgi:hypothetical protein